MKRVFLFITVIGFLTATSCKKDNTASDSGNLNSNEQVQEENQDTPKESQTITIDLDIPEFEDESVQNFANNYSDLYQEIKKAEVEDDRDKLLELQDKGRDLAERALHLTKGMSEEDLSKWNDWTEKISADAAQ